MEIVLNILHVVLAVFLIGPMAILPMTALRALRAGQHDQVVSLAKSTRIFTLLSLLVVIFGFGLQGMYSIPLTTPWILISIIAYAVALLLNLMLVVPAMLKAATAPAAVPGAVNTGAGAVNTGADDTAQNARASETRRYPQIAAGSGVVTLLLVLVTVLMVWKP